MTTFRLLHASDLHIAAQPELIGFLDIKASRLPWFDIGEVAICSTHDPDALEVLARFAFEMRDRLDAIVLTGDLATTGQRGDIAAAHRFVTSRADSFVTDAGEATLSGAPDRVLLIPGNHDRFKTPFNQPRAEHFDRLFQDYWRVESWAQRLAVLEKDEVFLGIVGLDLSLRSAREAGSNLAAIGKGRAYASICEQAKVLSQRFREEYPGIAVLWAVHFPPQFPNQNPTLALLEDQDLIDAAAAAGVSGILCGHTHREKTYTARSTGGKEVKIYCAGSASQHGEKSHTFSVIELSIDRHGIGVTREDFEVDHKRSLAVSKGQTV